jgi:hypothetical protein
VDEERRPEAAAGSDEGRELDETPSPAEAEQEAKNEAGLLAKIEMNVFGHP